MYCGRHENLEQQTRGYLIAGTNDPDRDSILAVAQVFSDAHLGFSLTAGSGPGGALCLVLNDHTEPEMRDEQR